MRAATVLEPPEQTKSSRRALLGGPHGRSCRARRTRVGAGRPIVRIPRNVIIAATIFAMTLAGFTEPGAGIRGPLNTLASKHT
jgi:hypothetical protein